MEDNRRDKAMRKKYKLYTGLLVVLLLIADQTTKFFAMHFLGTEKKIVLLESILELNTTNFLELENIMVLDCQCLF